MYIPIIYLHYMKKFYSILSILFLVVSLLPMQASAVSVTWTEQTGSGSRDWKSIASSSDGTKLAAVVNAGYIYTSTDSGTTWSTNGDSSGIANWRSISSSDDGTKLAAVVNAGYIYTSTDSGATWSTNGDSSGSRSWNSIASSSDGTKLVASVTSGYIYTSTDSGATWSTSGDSSGSRAWSSVSSSSDGLKLLATVGGMGNGAYTSTDGGLNWVNRSSFPGNPMFSFWGPESLSADGLKIVLAMTSTYVWTSTDGGVNFSTQSGSSGSGSWNSVSISPDGSALFASKFGGSNLLSTDGGATWSAQSSLSGLNIYSSSVFSSDNTKIAAVIPNGNIWTAVVSYIDAPTISTTSASNITDTTATLGGNITNTGGENNTARGFHYGLTGSYGSTSSESGSYSTGVYTADITGLDCNTTYHYRAFATNTAGTTNGSDSTFTTSSCPRRYGSSSSSSRYSAPAVSVVVAPAPVVVPVNVPTPTTIPNTKCTALAQKIRSGARDGVYNTYTKNVVSDVKILQSHMNRLGYGPIKEDGVFGLNTKSVVIKMQNKFGVTGDGLVGPKTREMINSSCAEVN